MNTRSILLMTVMLSSIQLWGQPEVEVKQSNVLALSTNFILPFARFNFNEGSNREATGSLSLFKSIGAGIALNYGRLTVMSEEDSNNESLDERFANAIGLQFGVLFSADLGADQATNVFAPTVSLNLLDFALGWGYELGTRTEGETGHFVTISYAIPLQKLTRKGTWVLSEWVPVDGGLMVK